MHNTQGIVLRSVKYGDTSLITTIFTSLYGVQPFMVQGVRSVKAARNRSGLLQPGMLLDMVVYHQPLKNMQRMREYQPAVIYQSILQDVIKNSVSLFSVEVLLRLLPDAAPLPDLFDFVYDYFTVLDKTPTRQVGNFPLFFIINCSRQLGFELKGSYSAETPHLDLQEGGYTPNPPALAPFMSDDDCRMLSNLIATNTYDTLEHTEMGTAMRMRLTEWYIAFLQRHTQHMGNIRSLQVLQAILH